MNVISIDLDYFVDVPDEVRREKFPNAKDLSRDKAKELWEEAYEKYPELKEIKVKDTEFDYVLLQLRNVARQDRLFTCRRGNFCRPGNHILYRDSHREIYDYILGNKRSHDLVNLIHIDHHHDFYIAGGNEVTCANWFFHLYNNYHTQKVMWVRNKDSEMKSLIGDFPLSSTTNIRNLKRLIETVFDNKDIIYPFICLSPEWVPYHLWSYFDNMVAVLSLDVEEIKNKNSYEQKRGRIKSIREECMKEVSKYYE